MLYFICKIVCLNNDDASKCSVFTYPICKYHGVGPAYLFYIDKEDIGLICYPNLKRKYKPISKSKLLLLASRVKVEWLRSILKRELKKRL